jgi:hypothetical protein
MGASPDSIVKRERVVMIVVAVVIAVLIAGGALAAGRGSTEGESAAASPSPSMTPTAATTLAAVEQAAAPGTQASPTAGLESPAASETPAEPTQPTQPTQAQQVPAARATSAPSSTATPRAASTPSPSPTRTRKPKAKPTPKPTKTASAVPSAAHIVVRGKVTKKKYFTVRQLKKMDVFSGDYFSRGKEPPELTSSFVGVRLIDLLTAAGINKDATKVDVLAADDHSASFSLRQVKAAWIDETRPGVTLPMIIAWSEDGVAYTGDHPFRLVMGQAVEGDYNRQYWVRTVVSLTVQ